MENLLPYIIKVNIGILLVYAVYYLLLKRETFFTLNRFYLLFGILFSFIYPFLQMDISLFEADISRQLRNVYYAELSPVIITADETTTNFGIGWESLLFAGVLFVTLVFIIRLLVQCASILFLKNKCLEKVWMDNSSIIDISNLSLAPFSFFQWIFIDIKNHSVDELREIITHEKIHVRQFHSIDVLISQLVCALFWWNPSVWLLAKDMKLNLEYIADYEVLQTGIDSKHYQYNLLNIINGKAAAITNNFNVSQLKKRIMMMNDKRTPLINLTKYIAIFPIIGILIFMNNCTSDSKGLFQDKVEPEMTTNLPDETQDSEASETSQSRDRIYEVAEIMPEYPGGPQALLEFMKENLAYPIEASVNGIEGKVGIRFVVDKDGKVDDVTVVEGFNEACDKEAVRVIKMLPEWKPGMQSGERVAVYYYIPVAFKLTKDRSKL